MVRNVAMLPLVVPSMAVVFVASVVVMAVVMDAMVVALVAIAT